MTNIVRLKEGPAHSFGWLHRHENDTATIEFWETPKGKAVMVPKKLCKHSTEIGEAVVFSPWVYDYTKDGERMQSLQPPV